METKKPNTRQYTSVKMAAHELRTKIIPSFERSFPNIKLADDVMISLVLVDGDNNVQIDIVDSENQDYLNKEILGGHKVADLRDLVVLVDAPVTEKLREGEHQTDQMIFAVEYWKFKPVNVVKKPHTGKKTSKTVKGTGLVPVQMDLNQYIEALDKRITESIRALLAEQENRMKEEFEDVKACVVELKEDVKEVKQGLVKLHAMFDKWREAFGTSKETLQV